MGVSYNTLPITTNGLILSGDSANSLSYRRINTWFDLSGNGNHVRLVNGATLNKGQLIFNGDNQYADILSATNFNMSGKDFSIEVWLSILNFSANERPILQYNLLPNDGFYGLTTFGNKLRFSLKNTYIEYTYDRLTSGATSQIVAQFSTTNNVMELFVNGERVAQQTSVTEEIVDLTDNMYILGYGGCLNFMRAALSVVRIYNRTLTQGEIKNNFRSKRSRFV